MKSMFSEYRQCTNCISRMDTFGGSVCMEHVQKCYDLDPTKCEFFYPKNCASCIAFDRLNESCGLGKFRINDIQTIPKDCPIKIEL